jgi:Fe-S oxidoreductase/nitrate reductase gamma subunit
VSDSTSAGFQATREGDEELLAAFDILLIVVAIIVMLVGLVRRWSVWQMGRPEERPGDLLGLIGYLFGHRRILRGGGVGIFHLLLFWGFVVPLVLVIVTQFSFTVPKGVARPLSLATDVLGCAMLVGTLFFLARRLKDTGPNAPRRVLLPLSLLLFILLTGLWAEGTRLRILGMGFDWASPVGWLFSSVSSDSPRFMQLMIRLHFFGVLAFIAIIPFTFLRHLAVSSLNVYYRAADSPGVLRGMSLEEGPIGAETIRDFSWKQLLDIEACVSCGRCDESCPAVVSDKPLSPQRVVQGIFGQMEGMRQQDGYRQESELPSLEAVISEDENWSCTMCMACYESCPVYIPAFDKLIDLRRDLVMRRSRFFPEIGTFFRDLETFGDTFGKGKAFREDWAIGRNIRKISKGEEVDTLFWVGCHGAFHDRAKTIVVTLTDLFKRAGLDYAILGKDETCCGDPLRRIGNEYLFQKLAMRNIEFLGGLKFNRIVTYCPHCLNVLKNEYPQLGGTFEVLHYTELLRDLVWRGDLEITKEMSRRVVYHDPCYLARANDIHTSPRDLLRSIPGMEIIEPEHAGRNTFCCGGGGGHMWMREMPGKKINEVRIEELVRDKPEMIVTSCPYCLIMFEDAVNSLGIENMRCMDLTEIIGSVI